MVGVLEITSILVRQILEKIIKTEEAEIIKREFEIKYYMEAIKKHQRAINDYDAKHPTGD